MSDAFWTILAHVLKCQRKALSVWISRCCFIEGLHKATQGYLMSLSSCLLFVQLGGRAGGQYVAHLFSQPHFHPSLFSFVFFLTHFLFAFS